MGINLLWISLSFLSIIYEVLYKWYLRYNICGVSFLDIRISTCNLFVVAFTLIGCLMPGSD